MSTIPEYRPLQNLSALSHDDLVGLLRNPLLSNEEILTGIRYVESLALKRSQCALFELIVSEARTEAVREAAAKALSKIADPRTKSLLVASFAQC